MDGIKEMAKLLKSRENQSRIGVGTGVVISVSPLAINFQALTLRSEDIVSSVSLSTLELMDRLIIVPSEDSQTFYVVGKEAG